MPKSTDKNKRCVLLVDDDRLILATLARGLEQAGYEVLQAESGEAGLRQALESQPDIAVLDVRMPGMSGVELARKLKETTCVPFIFLTAYGDAEFVRQAAEYGAVGYLIKPVDTAHIVPTIEAGLARAAEIKSLRETEANLSFALSSGRETSIAVGMLMERLRLNREDAFETLRQRARSQRRKVNEVASELVQAGEVLNVGTARIPD